MRSYSDLKKYVLFVFYEKRFSLWIEHSRPNVYIATLLILKLFALRNKLKYVIEKSAVNKIYSFKIDKFIIANLMFSEYNNSVFDSLVYYLIFPYKASVIIL